MVLTGWLLSEGGNSDGIAVSVGSDPAPSLPCLPSPSSLPHLPLPCLVLSPTPLNRTFLQTQVLLLNAWGSGEKVQLGLWGPPPTPSPVSLTLLE